MQSISNGDTGLAVRGKLNKELADGFTTLSDGSTVAWDCDNKKNPLAKLTSTQSFTINMTNVQSGASGVLKLTTNTASAITITLDTDFTNKSQNATVTTHTFPALTAQEYFLYFVVDGTTIEWAFGDGGVYQVWIPTWTGFSTPPTSGVARYSLEGKRCHCHQNNSVFGTSNGGSCTVTLPFAANFGQHYPIIVADNNVLVYGQLRTQNGSNVALITVGAALGSFTGSGNKGANFSIVYEIQ